MTHSLLSDSAPGPSLSPLGAYSAHPPLIADFLELSAAYLGIASSQRLPALSALAASDSEHFMPPAVANTFSQTREAC